MVVGREKALLISEDGEKYSPEEIEEAISNTSELINQVMIYNDHKRYTTAIVTLDKLKVREWSKKNEINDLKVLMKDIKNSFYKFKTEQEYRNKFPEKWIPSIFRIVEEDFSEENKMINSTMKMVRFQIVSTYQDLINDMYSSDKAKIICPQNEEIVSKIIKN